MSHVNSDVQLPLLKDLGQNLGATFPIAEVLGMPTWLVVAIVVILVLAALMWFWVGADLVRYIKIRRM
jgi:hypothetical protein